MVVSIFQFIKNSGWIISLTDWQFLAFSWKICPHYLNCRNKRKQSWVQCCQKWLFHKTLTKTLTVYCTQNTLLIEKSKAPSCLTLKILNRIKRSAILIFTGYPSVCRGTFTETRITSTKIGILKIFWNFTWYWGYLCT